MTFSPGDLVLIPFPYSDLLREKKRPVLVLTEPDPRGDFVGLAITSVAPQEGSMELEDSHLSEGALPKRSWVRLTKIYTLDRHLVVKKFGRLSDSVLRRVVASLCGVVGHAP